MNNNQRFVDHDEEQALLKRYAELDGLLVVLGRRRIGKTALLSRWIDKVDGLYTQAAAF